MADAEGWPEAGRRPGSGGEHELQRSLGTEERAGRFYDEQVLDRLNARMREFTQRQEMFFLATSDRNGECDSSFRAGPPGFLRVLDERTVAYPEYRGNGVHASLGNIRENPHLGILLMDFTQARIGLHINGRAELVEDDDLRAVHPDLPVEDVPGRRTRLWVRVTVEEAYIHCAKHIPHFQKAPKRTARDWGTDDYKRKGGDFFGTAREAQEARAEREALAERERQEARAAEEARELEEARAAQAAWERDRREQERLEQERLEWERAPVRASAAPPPPVAPPAPVPSATPAVPDDPAAWRLEAERALAEAQRRGAVAAGRARSGGESEQGGFQGWFG